MHKYAQHIQKWYTNLKEIPSFIDINKRVLQQWPERHSHRLIQLADVYYREAAFYYMVVSSAMIYYNVPMSYSIGKLERSWNPSFDIIFLHSQTSRNS